MVQELPVREVDLREDPAMRRLNRRAERLNRRENAKAKDLGEDEKTVQKEMDDLTLELKSETDPRKRAEKTNELADLKDELTAIGAKKKAVTDKFNQKGERAVEKVLGPKQDKLDAKLAQIESINKRLVEIEDALTALVKKGEDKTSNELRTEASFNKEKANLQEQLKSLEKKDNVVELKARQEAYKKMEAESKKGELLTLAQLENALNDSEVPLPVESVATTGTTAPTGGKAVVLLDKNGNSPLEAEVKFDGKDTTKEGDETISGKLDIILKALSIDLANLPNPKNTIDKLAYGAKATLFQLIIMFSGENTEWAKELSPDQKKNLEKGIGLKLVPGEEGKMTIEWITPEPEYQPPNKTVTKVFEKFFGKGEKLEKPFETITKDMTLKELEASLSKESDQSSEYVKKGMELVAKMKANGVTENDKVMAFLEKDGGKLLDADDEAVVKVQGDLNETILALSDEKNVQLFEKTLGSINPKAKFTKEMLFTDFLKLVTEQYKNITPIDRAVWDKVLTQTLTQNPDILKTQTLFEYASNCTKPGSTMSENKKAIAKKILELINANESATAPAPSPK
ncbi:MAG: hypothetical protein WC897_00690 [Candidatus Gracilibacteria bacterium]